MQYFLGGGVEVCVVHDLIYINFLSSLFPNGFFLVHQNVAKSTPDRAASWAKKVGGGQKVTISDRQLQISDIGNYGCLEFQFCP